MVAGPRGSQDASRSLPLGKTVDERTVWASQRQYTGQVCIETQTRDGVGQYRRWLWRPGFNVETSERSTGAESSTGCVEMSDTQYSEQ